MIEASKRGLPVDIDKIPPSLSAPAVTSPNKKVLSRQNTLPQVLQLETLFPHITFWVCIPNNLTEFIFNLFIPSI